MGCQVNQGRTIFSQLVEFLPKRDFRRLVDEYGGDRRIRSFSCWDQFLCMAFAQLTYRESLRDIETTLRAISVKLYHLGIRGKVSRSTLADANNNRDSRIFEKFAELVIGDARALYCDDKFSVELDHIAYCLDSTLIDLCLSLCPWAGISQKKGTAGVRLHTLLDLRGNIPSFIAVTTSKISELSIFDTLALEPGAFYIMDRGYFDWRRLYRITESRAFFVIRARRDLYFIRHYSNPMSSASGIISDHVGIPSNCKRLSYKDRSFLRYPQKIRRIRYRDPETGNRLVFLTNNFVLPARTIADLYKARWQIELFFKWIKQHLRIKTFYGTSENAVKTQIYIAMTMYVLIAIVKSKLHLPHELYTVLQVLSVTSLEKIPILSAFSTQSSSQVSDDMQISLNLWAN
jgi:hypothetical protein